MPSPIFGGGGILFLSALGPGGGESGSPEYDDGKPGGGFVRGTNDAGPVGALGGGFGRGGTNTGAAGLNFPPVS